MIRYYFDIRDNTGLYRDDEGLEFKTQREAEVEAAKSLANLAKAGVCAKADAETPMMAAARISGVLMIILFPDYPFALRPARFTDTRKT
jgi:hypothetical protein